MVKTWRTSYVLVLCNIYFKEFIFKVAKTISQNLIVKGWSPHNNYNYQFRILCCLHIKLLHIILLRLSFIKHSSMKLSFVAIVHSWNGLLWLECIHHVVYYEYVHPWKLYSHVQNFKMFLKLAGITLGWHLGPLYTMVEKCTGRSRILAQDMVTVVY